MTIHQTKVQFALEVTKTITQLDKHFSVIQDPSVRYHARNFIQLKDKQDVIKLITGMINLGYTKEIAHGCVFLSRVTFSHKMRLKYIRVIRVKEVDGQLVGKFFHYTTYPKSKYTKYTMKDLTIETALYK